MRIAAHRWFGAGALSAVGMLAAGCVVAPAPGPPPGYGVYAPGPPPAYGVYAPLPPPPPPVQVVPALPYPGAVWIGGWWNWGGGRYAWVPGYYARPYPGHRWEPHRWAPRPGGGWALQGGYWAR